MLRKIIYFIATFFILGLILTPKDQLIRQFCTLHMKKKEELRTFETGEKMNLQTLSPVVQKTSPKLSLLKIKATDFEINPNATSDAIKEKKIISQSEIKSKNILNYRPLFKLALPVPGLYQGIYGSLRRGLGTPESMQKSFFETELPTKTDELFAEYLPLPFSLSSSYIQAIYQPTDSVSIIFQKAKENYFDNNFDLKINYSKTF